MKSPKFISIYDSKKILIRYFYKKNISKVNYFL